MHIVRPLIDAMEALVITVRDEEKRSQIEQILRDTEGVESVQRVNIVNDVPLATQPSLGTPGITAKDHRLDSLL